MSNFQPNIVISDAFFEHNGTTGLVLADFTVTVFKDGVVEATAVSLTEQSNGFYQVSFTPDSVGLWSLDIVLDADDSVRYQMTYAVANAFASQASIYDLSDDVDDLSLSLSGIADTIFDEPASSHLIAGSIGDYINRIKKYACNRVVISGLNYSVKEDDNSTEFEAGSVSAVERAPS